MSGRIALAEISVIQSQNMTDEVRAYFVKLTYLIGGTLDPSLDTFEGSLLGEPHDVQIAQIMPRLGSRSHLVY